ncbi:MAG: hypothetical protein AAB471_01395 [Patescibacteria group bacterium]
MNTSLSKPISFVLNEEIVRTQQGYTESFKRCREILSEIENITKKRVLAYSSNFKSSYGVMDKDATVIEDLLRTKSDKKDLLLILSSPGGQAVAAEKIQLVCQEYSKAKKGKFLALVPKSAKSAATIIALGSDKILLSSTAELGPIDPQIIISNNFETGSETEKDLVGNKETVKIKKVFQNSINVIPAFRIIKAVDDLTDKSKKWWHFNSDSNKIFLSQYNYDLYLMAQNELKLSRDIIDKIIKRKNIKDPGLFKIFSDPEVTLSHNRPISLSDLNDSELHKSGFIEGYLEYFENDGVIKENLEKLDQLIWEYYLRTNTHLEDEGNFVQKTIETTTHRVQLGHNDSNVLS